MKRFLPVLVLPDVKGEGAGAAVITRPYGRSRIFSTDIFRLSKGIMDPSEVRFRIAYLADLS